MWLTTALIIALAVQGHGALVSYITPHIGGENGRVAVSIYGQDFPTDINLGSLGTPPKKEVHLVSEFVQYTCDIHEAESDEGKTVCYTRAMNPGTYYVRMKINEQWLATSEYCGGNEIADNCKFEVHATNTPTIDSLDSYSVEPRSLIKFYGTIFTDLLDSSNFTSGNWLTTSTGDAVIFDRVWLTSCTC